MNPEQIAIVRETWARLQPQADQVANRFYSRLFDLDPDLKPLFEADLEGQGERCMQCVDAAVARLDQPEQFRAEAAERGASHFFYSGNDDDFDNAGIAFLWALERLLGPEFRLDVRAAWAEFFGELTDAIREETAAAA